jgi:hypothetical protein
MNEINEKVSEIHRKQPNKRWMGSYTQRIVASLQTWQVGRAKFLQHNRWGITRKPIDDALERAINLLRDYHDTMHVVYEERDAARNELKTAVAKLNSAKGAVRYPLGQEAVSTLKRFTYTNHGLRFGYELVRSENGEFVSFNELVRVQKERDQARRHRDEMAAELKKTTEKRESTKFVTLSGGRCTYQGLGSPATYYKHQIATLKEDVISARGHAERLLKDAQAARVAGDEARAAKMYAETELRTCKQQLTDARDALIVLRAKAAKAVLTRRGFEGCV